VITSQSKYALFLSLFVDLVFVCEKKKKRKKKKKKGKWKKKRERKEGNKL
jgi:hypothetical protein